MIRKKKILITEEIPEFDRLIAEMPEDSKIFVDKSLEIANYVFFVMESKGWKQRDLADKLGKTEAEISKWLTGMHNYTLRTIAKLEAALEEMVICVPHRTFSSLAFPNTKTGVKTKTAFGQKENLYPPKVNYGGRVIPMPEKQEVDNSIIEMIA